MTTLRLSSRTPLFEANGPATVALSAMMGEPNHNITHKAITLTEEYFGQFDIAFAHAIACTRSYSPATLHADYDAMVSRITTIFNAIPFEIMESVHNDIVSGRHPVIPQDILPIASNLARHFPATFGTTFQIAILPQELSGHFMHEGWTLTGPLTLDETPSPTALDAWRNRTKRPLCGNIPSMPSVTYDNDGHEKGIILGTIRDLPHELIHMRQATATTGQAQKNHLYAMAEEARTVIRIMGSEKVARAASLTRDLENDQTLNSLVMFGISCTSVPLDMADDLMNEIGVSRGNSIGAILSLAGILEQHPNFIEKKSESQIAYELVAYRHENAIVLPSFA